MKNFLTGLMACMTFLQMKAQSHKQPDAILGYWKADEKVLTIEVYRRGGVYNAKIISFTDHHNNTPVADRKDDKNPDPALRNRKVIGMDVLTKLTFDASEKKWTNGVIYNVGSGKKYSATVELTNDGKLSVRAYKGISILGKTMTFSR